MAYSDAVLERYTQGEQCIFTEYAKLYTRPAIPADLKMTV